MVVATSSSTNLARKCVCTKVSAAMSEAKVSVSDPQHPAFTTGNTSGSWLISSILALYVTFSTNTIL
jgi:ribosomal protein L31